MIVPKFENIDEALRGLSSHAFEISCVNWPDKYPYAPEVNFGIAHTGTHIVLRFVVREKYTVAVTVEDNGPVWEDSCVEFFLSLDSSGYYNFEFNCIGTKLLGFRKERNVVEHGSPQVMASIKTFPSLCVAPFESTESDNCWSLDAIISAGALFRHATNDFSGLEARANFYKCGDKLPEPHFLSHAPIEWPEPNFHLEQFFVPVNFAR